MTNDAPIRGLANRTCPRLPALLLGVLLAAAGNPSWAQVPDNRGVRLDPEDPVPPAYRDTLEARDRQRLDAAREQGASFLPTFQGRGRAPEGEATAPETAGAAPVLPEPMLRPPRAAPPPPVSAYETFGRERPRGGGPDDGLAELLHVLLETWSRAPEVVRLRYAAGEPERTLVLHGGDVLHERGRNTARRQLFAGLGAAARSVGDVLLEDAPRAATVRIPRDTELLVMFAAPLGGPAQDGRRSDAGQ